MILIKMTFLLCNCLQIMSVSVKLHIVSMAFFNYSKPEILNNFFRHSITPVPITVREERITVVYKIKLLTKQMFKKQTAT